MSIVIIIKQENNETSELLIDKEILLGRSRSCDFVIKDQNISGVHCKLEVDIHGQLVLTDLESRNGTYINNEKILKSFVKVNDIVKIGNTTIMIDAEKLSNVDLFIIGTSINLPVIKNTQPTKEAVIVSKEKSLLNKSIISLSKELSQKKRKVPAWMGNDPLIDEEVTGLTKFLKIEKMKKN
jgi:pSer/pThr/pTyr-binding forkhead associated (FHA) protein